MLIAGTKDGKLKTQKKFSRIAWKGLLVVAVIAIAITAAVINEAIQNARESANQRQCLLNLKQLWSASMMYAQDYDGWMPIYVNDTNPDRYYNKTRGLPSPEKLHLSLDSYVKNKSAWFCPSDKSAGKHVTNRGCDHQFSSYKFLFLKPGMLRSDGLVKSNKLIKARPAMIRAIGDPYDFVLIQDDPFSTILGEKRLYGPHLGMRNAVYLDGHADSIMMY